MTRTEKTAAIEELREMLSATNCFYVTDCSTMTVAQINKLRRICFEKGISLRVAKNTLVRKALEQISETAYTGIYDVLHGPTAVMISENAKEPAKMIKEFRGKEGSRPTLKGAWIDSSTFIGDDQIDTLMKLKSKEELLGEIIGLLQSPASNVIGALQSAGTTIAGIVKTLEERG